MRHFGANGEDAALVDDDGAVILLLLLRIIISSTCSQSASKKIDDARTDHFSGIFEDVVGGFVENGEFFQSDEACDFFADFRTVLFDDGCALLLRRVLGRIVAAG